MAACVELFPGFPIPLGDYTDLLQELDRRGRWDGPVRIAHSLGSLDVLARPSDPPTALLAPSVPGRRPGRLLARSAIAVASHTPASAALAGRLRATTYRRYGATPPPGDALPLHTVAQRLRSPTMVALPAPSRIIVICSQDDPRHPDQTELARRLGAAVHWVDGGHLFPIANPAQTAAIIAEAFGFVWPD